MLKLTTTESSSNMYLFNHECKLHKYASVYEIIDEFYGIRLSAYQRRKAHLIINMEKLLVRLSNRARYIMENLNGTIDLRKKTSQEVTDLLTQKKYTKIDDDYKYLVKMPMDSVTTENVANIIKEKEETEAELATLISTTPGQIWYRELDSLEKEYVSYKAGREQLQQHQQVPKKTNKKITTVSNSKK